MIPLSPSALASFFECQRHTWLEGGVARGERTRPGQNEIERLLLERRGLEHERRVLELYRARGGEVLELSSAPPADAAARERAAEVTLAAMQRGVDVICQGTLLEGSWSARPDFLVKASISSRFGVHGYEVVDAKLAHHAKARALIQLCTYTDQLSRLQGAEPERFWIASAGDSVDPEPFRSANYLAYYRLARARFEAFVANGAQSEPYPEPVEFCDVCRYWKECEERRRADDHTSLVAGITRRQRDRLAGAGIATLAGLADVGADTRIEGIDGPPLRRIREQARLQRDARATGQPRHELLLEVEAGAGLERLPEPTPGDLFFDLEGDPHALGGGLEYLFGWVDLGEPSMGWGRREAGSEPRYQRRWAETRARERAAFTAFMQRVQQGRLEFPNLHVFHFGHREPDALKRLSCRHGTMEEEVDALLREHVLVDLHTVFRQGVRASVEGYTLKQIEVCYGFRRDMDRRAAARAMQLYGYWLETGHGQDEVESHRESIERYNKDDVLSVLSLRNWLEERRLELAQRTGKPLGRPHAEAVELSGRQGKAEVLALAEALGHGLPDDSSDDTPEQAARRLLAHLINWHWRELKSSYWDYYRAKELPASERVEDRAALSGLEYEATIGEVKQSLVHRYRFPPQEHAIRRTPGAEDPDAEGGKGKGIAVVAVGSTHIDLKRAKKSRDSHPHALIPARPLSYDAQEQNLWVIARAVVNHGCDPKSSEFPSACALLLREPPQCGQAPGASLLRPGEDSREGVVRLALELQRGVLAVQGPPGSGKTHRAAMAIVALIESGARVGVTANSHQVILSLLGKCTELARERGISLAAHHIAKAEDHEGEGASFSYAVGNKYPDVLDQLKRRELQLVGGTTFAWSRADFRSAVDVLVVDEAAQVSLANVLAAAPAAPKLLLFGDPAQLEQPQRGVHPPGADVSALEHLMGQERLTMPEHLGVFLPETRRLHPALCEFTSRVFYEGRLAALPGLERQAIEGAGRFSGSGLRWLPVAHRGNTNCSDEEVNVIVQLIAELLQPKGAVSAEFRDARAGLRPLVARDVLVVAPYNAQVAALRRALPAEVPVGTVDKFQGQEAPLVIYSMTSSSAADAPRGFEFLYSLNRLNVATSHALCLVIIVSSPDLASAQCRTPRQMQLVNALCSYLELSQKR